MHLIVLCKYLVIWDGSLHAHYSSIIIISGQIIKFQLPIKYFLFEDKLKSIYRNGELIASAS